MATKQNIYAKCKSQVDHMNLVFDQTVICYQCDSDRNPTNIALGIKQKAIENRDIAIETIGMLKALISGLDKSSDKLPSYQNCLYKCNAIIKFAQ